MAGIFTGCQQEPVDIIDTDLTSEKNNVKQSVLVEDVLSGGALYEISLPDSWSEDWSSRILVVYAHGYVDPGQPIALPTDVIPDGMSGKPIKEFIIENDMGYASTSYRDNGLVVLDAVEDIKELRYEIEKFFEDNKQDLALPNAYVLVGPSEGGLITVLTMEGNPGLFQGAISTCAPIGNFYRQLQYYGDAHGLFKYFFGLAIKGINLGSPKKMSKHTMNAWIVVRSGKSWKKVIIQKMLDIRSTNF